MLGIVISRYHFTKTSPKTNKKKPHESSANAFSANKEETEVKVNLPTLHNS